MINKIPYVVQPYEVGAKYRKSLAIVIPAKVAKENHINKHTVFALWIDQNSQGIMLQNLDPMIEANVKPVGESFQASNQQASRVQ
jgi:hypothetical protein